MKVAVLGLWHLGTVTAAGLASVGHDVTGLDDDAATIASLAGGKAPLFEPGLDDLVAAGIASGRLHFTDDITAGAAQADVLWVAFDTPVDDDDRADIEFVLARVRQALPALRDGTIVLVSSQLPVGSTRALESWADTQLPDRTLHFACAPENLRLGKAIDVFLHPDRIVVGVRDDAVRTGLEPLLTPLTDRIEWMSVESAEMTKHAINAFLATSVTFANEIAALCELVGADAKDVERGLKSETRIGPKAYLAPGGPFAGGTLARDIEYLRAAGEARQLPTPLLSSVRTSNDAHKHWTRRRLLEQLGPLAGITVAIWGLAYKPGTDTLRRSLAVELVDWLLDQGAHVHVHDPRVRELPAHWTGRVRAFDDALACASGARALVVGTEWPVFREVAAQLANVAAPGLVVLDANRHLQRALAATNIVHLAVGTPAHTERP